MSSRYFNLLIILFQAVGFNLEDYENVSNWLERIQTFAPGYEKANGEPCAMFKQFVEDIQGEKGDEEKEGEEEKEEKEEGEEGEENE